MILTKCFVDYFALDSHFPGKVKRKEQDTKKDHYQSFRIRTIPVGSSSRRSKDNEVELTTDDDIESDDEELDASFSESEHGSTISNGCGRTVDIHESDIDSDLESTDSSGCELDSSESDINSERSSYVSLFSENDHEEKQKTESVQLPGDIEFTTKTTGCEEKKTNINQKKISQNATQQSTDTVPVANPNNKRRLLFGVEQGPSNEVKQQEMTLELPGRSTPALQEIVHSKPSSKRRKESKDLYEKDTQQSQKRHSHKSFQQATDGGSVDGIFKEESSTLLLHAVVNVSKPVELNFSGGDSKDEPLLDQENLLNQEKEEQSFQQGTHDSNSDIEVIASSSTYVSDSANDMSVDEELSSFVMPCALASPSGIVPLSKTVDIGWPVTKRFVKDNPSSYLHNKRTVGNLPTPSKLQERSKVKPGESQIKMRKILTPKKKISKN